MGKIPVKIRSVVYGLSPFEQKVMPGLWKEFTHKITHKVTENWLNTVLLVGPVVGVYSGGFLILVIGFVMFFLSGKFNVQFKTKYVQSYQESEKLEHRY